MALNNMARRLRPGNRLPGSVDELERDYQGFEADFLEFMPEVIEFAESQALVLEESADWRRILYPGSQA